MLNIGFFLKSVAVPKQAAGEVLHRGCVVCVGASEGGKHNVQCLLIFYARFDVSTAKIIDGGQFLYGVCGAWVVGAETAGLDLNRFFVERFGLINGVDLHGDVGQIVQRTKCHGMAMTERVAIRKVYALVKTLCLFRFANSVESRCEHLDGADGFSVCYAKNLLLLFLQLFELILSIVVFTK